MKFSISTVALAVSALLFALPTSAQSAAEPTPTVALKAITYVGCYSDSQPLKNQGSYTFQSPGYCQKVCAVLNKPVMATQKGSNCWCGDQLPNTGAKTSESDCNSPCDGFGQDMCGGENAWSVSLDGLSDNVDTFGGSSGSGASSTDGSSNSGTKTTASPSVITEAGQTIIVTAPGNPKATSQSSSGGPSKAGIAAGVVAGILAICAAVGGLFFFLRARKRKSVEEAYRRNAAINQFVQGGGRKQTSEGSSVNDSRLDPSIMVQRRMSDGSIADNQDYSRRILKVANPDGPR